MVMVDILWVVEEAEADVEGTRRIKLILLDVDGWSKSADGVSA